MPDTAGGVWLIGYPASLAGFWERNGLFAAALRAGGLGTAGSCGNPTPLVRVERRWAQRTCPPTLCLSAYSFNWQASNAFRELTSRARDNVRTCMICCWFNLPCFASSPS